MLCTTYKTSNKFKIWYLVMMRVWGNRYCHIVLEGESIHTVISGEQFGNRYQSFKCTFHPEIPLLGIYPRDILARVLQSLFKRMVITTLSYRKIKSLRYWLIGNWLNKLGISLRWNTIQPLKVKLCVSNRERSVK